MCDYSLHHVASRPAKVSDKLVTTKLTKSSARGFAAVGEHGAKLVIHDSPPKVAVCLLPGTELAFDHEVQYDRPFSVFGNGRINHKVARFRQIDLNDPHVQHDALEFPNGQVLKLTQLVAGQTATVLQLPVASQHSQHLETRHIARSSDSRVTLNRAGTASILVPNQGAVMLWQSFRSTAASLSAAVGELLTRLKAHKQHPIPADVHAEIEPTSNSDLLAVAVTLPNKSAGQKPEKKTQIQAAA